MKLFTLLSAAYLAAGVASIGYRTAYEKIWLFYAWQIDQLRPESERRIGYKCAVVIDTVTGGCADVPSGSKYIACTVKVRQWNEATKTLEQIERACQNLKEFINFIDDTPRQTQNPISGGSSAQNNLTPDVDSTANQMHKANLDKILYPPWRVVKDGTFFNTMITEVSNIVADVKSGMTAAEFNEHKSKFDGLSTAVGRVQAARFDDHSFYLIDFLKTQLPGVDLKFSPSPWPRYFRETTGEGDSQTSKISSEPGVHFELQKTIDDNKAAFPDIKERLEAAYAIFYADNPDPTAEPSEAVKHKVVMANFEAGKNQIEGVSCSV